MTYPVTHPEERQRLNTYADQLEAEARQRVLMSWAEIARERRIRQDRQMEPVSRVMRGEQKDEDNGC